MKCVLFLIIVLPCIICQRIDGSFDICSQTNTIIDLDNSCPKWHTIEVKNAKKTKVIALLERYSHIVDGVGFECRINEVTKSFSYNYLFYGEEIVESRRIIIPSVRECNEMVTIRKCKGNSIICEGEYCSYKPVFKPKFSVMSTHRQVDYECYVVPRVVQALIATDILFNSNNRCQAKDQKCIMHDSTIVWNKEEVLHECPFKYIGLIDAQIVGNYSYFAAKYNLYFHVDTNEKIINACGITIMPTNEGNFF